MYLDNNKKKVMKNNVYYVLLKPCKLCCIYFSIFKSKREIFKCFNDLACIKISETICVQRYSPRMNIFLLAVLPCSTTNRPPDVQRQICDYHRWAVDMQICKACLF